MTHKELVKRFALNDDGTFDLQHYRWARKDYPDVQPPAREPKRKHKTDRERVREGQRKNHW